MDTSTLKKFAQSARRTLIDQVSAKLTTVLADDSPARRERRSAVADLEKQIQQNGKEQVIEQVAYTWFNRFCALRFMDVNRYSRIGIVSPAEGQVQPEILADAKLGHMDETIVPHATQQQILALLGGQTPSRDPQAEAYRLLLVASCNHYYRAMPFLFERIDHYTELLLPDDLLSGTSILAETREAMTPAACADVEVIGWLYQFYISEKKDEVFDGLKKNKKITPENIPAATQLFTPHWIVRYLVENSLGRLWLLNRPNSRLAEKMDYYIQPEEETTKSTNGTKETTKNTNTPKDKDEYFREVRDIGGSDFLKISSPEELKICDPACGSGHMLVYAFDLLYAIYEEEGYAPAEIPAKILTHNLYGVEIDERAGALAAFALTMKARQYDRRFFSRTTPLGELAEPKPVEPQICVLENIEFTADELNEYMDFVGRDLFTNPLFETLHQFADVKNVGSLIRPIVSDESALQKRLEDTNVSGHLFYSQTHEKVQQALEQASYLSPQYHVVIANPPYMGRKGMNDELKDFADSLYPNSKADLFAMFIERNLDLVQPHGSVGMITMQSWMFLSSYEKLRDTLLTQDTILSMAHLGARAFDTIGGEVVSTTTFVIGKDALTDFKGDYLRLIDGNSEAEKEKQLLTAIQNPDCGWFHRASAADFKKIPGSPIAYWVSSRILDSFSHLKLRDCADAKQGMATSNNDRFLRFWHEVEICEVCTNCETLKASESRPEKWYAYNKGGQFRRWYGNNEYLVNWQYNGAELKAFVEELNKIRPGGRLKNQEYYFRENITYSALSSGLFSARYNAPGFLFDTKGSCIFTDSGQTHYFLSLLNSNTSQELLNILCPTLDYSSIGINAIPLVKPKKPVDPGKLIGLARNDWNSYETSWDFVSLPLLASDYRQTTLKAKYTVLRLSWQQMVVEMQRLEEENNRIFIDAYGLQDELTPDVALNEITLTCNPHYRYSSDKTEAELEALLLADTMREFISYAVGCMFGRYSLDKPGLILANQGETTEDYYAKISTTKDTNGTKIEEQFREFSAFRGSSENDTTTKEMNKTKEEENIREFSAFRGSCTFPPDEDNAIPMLDGDWFPDDVSERFRTFLRVTFGEEHYEANLAFIEEALGKDIRKYFLRDFYNDHVKRYKKRPIYWLFSSPKGSFNVLIYMHRYRDDTVDVVLNDYLREFRTKLTARKTHLEAVSINPSEAQGVKTKALKEIEKLNKTIDELESYERDVLYPLATEKVSIDLDDGVKVNYNKFGAALKKVTGLSGK